MTIKKGRNFYSQSSDTLHGIIVNENMVNYFGWDNPIGKRVKFPGDTSGRYWEVVGVVKDFNQQSLYNPIAPLIIRYNQNNYGFQLKLDQRISLPPLPALKKHGRHISLNSLRL